MWVGSSMLESFSSSATFCAGTFSIASTVPARRSATWLGSSGTIWITTRSTLGRPGSKYFSLRTSTSRCCGVQFSSLKGPLAHQVLVEIGGVGPPFLVGDLVPHVFGQDHPFVGVDQLGGVRLLEVVAHGQRVDHLDVVDLVLGFGVLPADLGRLLGIEGEEHVVGGDRLAVGPGDAGTQLEGELQAVGRKFPAFGEARLHLRRAALVVGLLFEQLEEKTVIEEAGMDRRGRRQQLVQADDVGMLRHGDRGRSGRRMFHCFSRRILAAAGQRSHEESAGDKEPRHPNCAFHAGTLSKARRQVNRGPSPF